MTGRSVGRRPTPGAVARAAVLIAATGLAGCADAGAPALEGAWEARTGRFVSWQIVLGNEGTGVIGRASYSNSAGIVFRATPVYGPYPQVRYDVTVANRPTTPSLVLRYVFSGRLRDDCNAERGACVRGSLTVWGDGQPTGPAQWLDFYRAPS